MGSLSFLCSLRGVSTKDRQGSQVTDSLSLKCQREASNTNTYCSVGAKRHKANMRVLLRLIAALWLSENSHI